MTTYNEFPQQDIDIANAEIGKVTVDKLGNKWQHPIYWSYGGGLDSSAGIIRMKELGVRPNFIIIADVGAEHDYTWQTVKAMDEWCAANDFPEITVVDKYTPRARYTGIEGNLLANETLPSLAFHMHGCSMKWKIKVIDTAIAHCDTTVKSMEQGIRVTRCIGYDYGCADSKRFAKADAKEKKAETEGKVCCWNTRYPLREWLLGRDKLDAVISSNVAFGDLMEKHTGRRDVRKSSCYFCPAAKLHEVEELGREFPELALKVAAIEYRAETGKNGLSSVNGLGLNSAEVNHEHDKVTGKSGWSWHRHLVAIGLLSADWKTEAIAKGYLSPIWDEYSVECSALRKLIEDAKTARFEAASKLPSKLFDKVFPPKAKSNKKKSERENRSVAKIDAIRNVIAIVEDYEVGTKFKAAHDELERLLKVKTNTIAPEWRNIIKASEDKDVASIRRQLTKQFKEAAKSSGFDPDFDAD